MGDRIPSRTPRRTTLRGQHSGDGFASHPVPEQGKLHRLRSRQRWKSVLCLFVLSHSSSAPHAEHKDRRSRVDGNRCPHQSHHRERAPVHHCSEQVRPQIHSSGSRRPGSPSCWTAASSSCSTLTVRRKWSPIRTHPDLIVLLGLKLCVLARIENHASDVRYRIRNWRLI